MADYFAILGLPRRPWLDPEHLKNAFHQRAATEHPDVAGSESQNFSLLNVAYSTLRDPKSRLQHLLDLEAPEFSQLGSQAPAELGTLFMQVGQTQQKANLFLAKYAAASSPLQKALMSSQKFELLEELETCLASLNTTEEAAVLEAKTLDATWHLKRDYQLLQKCCLKLSYLGRWHGLLSESIARLAID